MNGPGLSAYSRTTKMRAKRSNMPYFNTNFLRFDHLHQLCPFQVSPNVRNYDFVAKITPNKVFVRGLDFGQDWTGLDKLIPVMDLTG